MARARRALGPRPAPIPAPAPPCASEPLLPARWWRFPDWLAPPRDALAPRVFVLVLAAIWLVGTLVRCGWLFRAGWSEPSFQWHGVPLLGTPDAHFFATGVDVALSGNLHALVRFAHADESAIVTLAWLATKLLPCSLQQVLLYLPAIVAPLVAVPTALLGRELCGPRAGLLAGLLAAIAPLFVGRSSAGFFDTDVFSVAVPLFAVWLIVRLLRHGRARDGLLAALVLSALPFFHEQGGPVGAALAATAAAVLAACYRAESYFPATFALLGLSQAPLPWALRTALLVPLWFGLRRAPLSPRVLRSLAVALGLAGLALSSEWAVAFARLRDFLGAAGASPGGPADDLVLGDTTRAVGEAQRLPLGQLGRDIIGSTPAFLAAMIGGMLLQLRHRAVLVLLPLVGLGLFALVGGNRFAIYASPPAAIGLAMFATVVLGRMASQLRALSFAILAAVVAVPTAFFAAGTVVTSALVHDEVEALDALGQVAHPGDTTIAWWDWGYAIGYYGHTRTLVDGGARGDDAALAAEVLLGPSQHGAALLARLAIEVANRQDGATGKVADGLFRAVREQLGVSQMDYLRGLRNPSVQPPPATSQVYLYLPLRMLGMLRTVALARPHEASVPPAVPVARAVFTARALANPARIDLQNGYVVFVDEAVVRAAGRPDRPLKALYVVRGVGPTHHVDGYRNPAAGADALNGIYLADDRVYVELDDALMASVYVQLLVFERPDPELFELVFANSAACVYRLKL